MRIADRKRRLTAEQPAADLGDLADRHDIGPGDVERRRVVELQRGGDGGGGVIDIHRIDMNAVRSGERDLLALAHAAQDARDEHVALARAVDEEEAQHMGPQQSAVLLGRELAGQLRRRVEIARLRRVALRDRRGPRGVHRTGGCVYERARAGPAGVIEQLNGHRRVDGEDIDRLLRELPVKARLGQVHDRVGGVRELGAQRCREVLSDPADPRLRRRLNRRAMQGDDLALRCEQRQQRRSEEAGPAGEHDGHAVNPEQPARRSTRRAPCVSRQQAQPGPRTRASRAASRRRRRAAAP